MDFRKFLESEETLEGYLSVSCIFHSSAGAPRGYCFGRTAQDLGLSGGASAGDDSIAQRCGNRDEVEVRVSASHRDTRDGHSVQGIEATISALFVVELKGCYSRRDNLRLCVRPVDLVVDQHQEDEGSVNVDKGETRPNNRTSFAENSERNGVMY